MASYEALTYPFAYAGPQPIMDPKERFYRQFHQEVATLQDRIVKLGSIAVVGGERQDARDSILTSISKLSLEVADASDYIPAYDQRTYSEAVKALTEQLNEELARLTPKSRFQFKRTNRTTAPTAADPRLLRGTPLPAADSKADAASTQPAVLPSGKNYNAELSGSGGEVSSVRKPSFSSAREVALSGHAGLHIILPLSASRATASGSLTHLRGCVVDMSVPTSSTGSSGGAAFLSLVLKDMDRCLIVSGHVSGPVHVTGLRDCVVVVAARQVRIHECRNVDLYLHCGSRPIIEDCSGMRFAPLPHAYASPEDEAATNHWDEVDDFKWLKADQSPNWSILPEDARLPETVWTGAVAGAGMSTEDVLKAVGIDKK
ncbi:tubulin-specific chaperone [Grosmannia clavigera kw1407]|uniref:Tubulin-specific chaperone n=1 Tax=Grosmannia clavigera (strain kw1407 / UAMH 11150) TaxID=655863 RepID=F0XNA9_GROCL|nr:tubulin-specific chaperone [Grosmannia clavigera kw1407]EFX00830.1 tubulin-specific chaperone [Grosmannia clavigera kw1407]